MSLLKKISTAALIVLVGVGVMVLIILLTSCSTPVEPPKKSRFSGDHTTTQIRGLWYVCIQARQRSMPYVPPQIHTAHCDCVMDKSREQFSAKDYDRMTQDNLSRSFTNINIDCSVLHNFEPVKVDPASL